MTKEENIRQLYWTKDAFSLKYSMYDNGQLVGFIKDSSTSRSVKASIFGRKFIFESEGIFKPRINIIDMDQREVIGKIKLYTFTYKAEIHYSGATFHWKFSNTMNTKWSLLNMEGKVIFSADNRKEGYSTVENEKTGVLLLASLIIRNYFRKQDGN